MARYISKLFQFLVGFYELFNGALQLLRSYLYILFKLFREGFLVVHIGAGAYPHLDMPVTVLLWYGAAQLPAVFAVGAPEAVLEQERLPVVHRGSPVPHAFITVF